MKKHLNYFQRFIGYMSKALLNIENILPVSATGALTVVEIMANMGVPFLFMYTINSLTDNTISLTQILFMAGGTIICYEVGKWIPTIKNYALNSVGLTFSQNLTHDVVEKFYRLPWEHRLDNTTAPIVQYFGAAYESFGRTFGDGIIGKVLPAFSELIIGVVLLSRYYGYAGLAAGLVLLTSSIISALGVGRVREAQLSYIEKLYDGYGRLIEQAGEYEVAHLYGNVDLELGKTDDVVKRLSEGDNNMLFTRNMLKIIQSLIVSIGFTGIATFIANSVRNKIYSPSDFMWVVLFLNQLSQSTNKLTEIVPAIYADYVRFGEIMRYLDAPNTEEKNKPDFQCSKPPTIEFVQVSFIVNKKIILNNISFKIKRSEILFITGLSGEGKTTILNLLFGFCKPTSGIIKINGKDMQQYSLDSIRKIIGFVPQKPMLFDETILENIRYGNRNATQEKILAAAKKSGLGKVLEKYENNKIGAKGDRLSGGEKQRVSIARSYIGNPQILLLDEFTSALDGKTEDGILKSTCELIQESKQTTIMVTHKLNTVFYFNGCNYKIIVMEGGKIVEWGTLSELNKKENGYFKQQLKLSYEQMKGITFFEENKNEENESKNNSEDEKNIAEEKIEIVVDKKNNIQSSEEDLLIPKNNEEESWWRNNCVIM